MTERPISIEPSPDVDREAIIAAVVKSAAFGVESAYLKRSGSDVVLRPRLFKRLEGDSVRLIFPTDVHDVDEGTAVGLVCLYDLGRSETIYAHAIYAGATANASLRSLFNPPTQAKPQPGIAGDKAILKFVAWKAAAWAKFLNDELELGTTHASEFWLASFWKALDRMYGGGNLLQ